MLHKVYVYGTLRKGGRLSGALEHSEYVATEIARGFRLYNIGWYPGVKKTDNPNDNLLVESYNVTDDVLLHLDHIEGHPSLFLRTPWNGGYIYIYQGEVREENRIESGDWFKQAN